MDLFLRKLPDDRRAGFIAQTGQKNCGFARS
jgi:hypothetical protein